jgi:hypothetical protein
MKLRLDVSRKRSVQLGALALVSLVAAFVLAPRAFIVQAEILGRKMVSVLPQTEWVWPVAVTMGVALLTSPYARHRWPKWTRLYHGITLTLGLVVVAVFLTAWPRQALLALSALAAIGLLAAWVVVLPRRHAPPLTAKALRGLSDPQKRLEQADARLKLQNDLRTTALQAIGGLAVLAGALLAFQQLSTDRQKAIDDRELTRQGQASERFTTAIGQLGSDRREVQLGAIYGLEQIATQAPDNRLAVVEVLVAYLHRRTPQPDKPADPLASSVAELRDRAPDVQAALTVLGRRKPNPNDPPLDLRGLDLRRADLHGADLSKAKLDGTDLTEADLSGANLSSTKLGLTKLSAATFSGATLIGTSFYEGNLSFAHFSGTDLSQTTDLDVANLRDADADHTTKWPNGIDPHDKGVTFTDEPHNEAPSE